MSIPSRKEFLKSYGSEAKNRCTGRSTAIAFRTISQAMLNPGYPQHIEDHHNSHEARRHNADLIREIIDKLDLHGFTFNKKNFTITYDLNW